MYHLHVQCSCMEQGSYNKYALCYEMTFNEEQGYLQLFAVFNASLDKTEADKQRSFKSSSVRTTSTVLV